MALMSELPNLITPLPIYGLLLLAAIAWRTRSALWLVVLAWAYVMSIPAVADRAADLLERQYRPIADLSPYRGYPVLLLSSGGKRWDRDEGFVNLLANSGWERLLVAVKTVRQVEGELIIAGGPPKGAGSEPIAVTMQNVVLDMGIDLKAVTAEKTSINTFENLANLKEKIEKKPFIMVTSASHLPRAMMIAEKLGLEAIPQPADFLTGRITGIRRFVPTAVTILHWDVILHEFVGILYYKLKGWA